MTDKFARRFTAALFLVTTVVLGAALRWCEIDASLWLDEVYTYEGANRSMWYALGHRSYPLYYALSNIALRFDKSETALRFPSFVAGVLTIPVMFFFSARVCGVRVAVVSTLLLTVNVFHIRFSQEARFYSLVMLGSVLMTWFLYRALTQGRVRDWLAFTVAAYFSLISQLSVLPYFGAMVVGAAVWIVVSGPREQRSIPWKTLLRLGISVTFAISGLCAGLLSNSSLLSILGWVQWDSGSGKETAKIVQVYRLTISQYGEYLLHFTPVQPRALRLVLAGLACAGVGALWRKNRCLATIVSAQFVIAPIPYLLFDSNHWYAARYFCSLTPLYLLLIAMGIVAATSMAVRLFCGKNAEDGDLASTRPTDLARTHSRRRALGLNFALLGTVALALAPSHAAAIDRYFEVRPYANWKGLAAYMAGRIQPHETILLLPPPEGIKPRPIGVLRAPLHYYLVRSLPAYFPDNHRAVMGTLRYRGAKTLEEFHSVIAERPDAGVWFVMEDERNLPEGIEDAIRDGGITNHESFGLLNVYHRAAPPQQNGSHDEPSLTQQVE